MAEDSTIHGNLETALCAVGDILFANGSTQVIRLVLWLAPGLG